LAHFAQNEETKTNKFGERETMRGIKGAYVRLLTTGSVLAGLLAVPGGVAFAQTVAQSDGDSEAAQASQSGIQDIVVTAQKREESLQRTALAVSAVGGDDLINAGVSDTQGLTKLVPSLVVQPSVGAATNFYLRGVGSFAANAFTENPISFNFAGVYIARPAAPAGTFYDLQRVEVLKGPQGTLYGRNATGGAINVIPKAPSLSGPEMDLLLEFGNYNSIKTSAAANLPISDTLALRIAGQITKRDGYLSDGYDDDDGQAVRASLLAEPSDRIAITLIGDYYHQGGKGNGAVLVPGALVPNAPDPDKRIGNSDPRSIAVAAAAFPGLIPTGLIASPKSDGFLDNEFWGVSANIDIDLDFATLTILPAYRDSRPDYLTYNAGYLGRVTEVAKQSSLEVRLASNGTNRLQYVIGGYLFREKQNDQNLFDQGLLLTTFFDTEIINKSYAVFGQGTYELFDGFRLLGGLRYTKDRKSNDTLFLQTSFGAGNPVRFANKVTFEKVTWKAGVEYDAAPDSLVYANVSTGFKSGGFFIAPLDNTFDPENLTAYTLGSKNRFYDNKVQLNLEAFYWDYKDQQVNYIGPTRVSATAVGAGLVTANAGQSRMYGAEVQLLFEPTRNSSFSAEVQYLNAKFNEFSYLAASATGAPPRIGCPVSPSTEITLPAPGQIFRVDCSGKPQINAPKWTANLSYDHTFELNADLNLTLGANTRIESGRYLSPEYLPEQRQDSYMQSSAYVTFAAADRQWSLTGFVNNIEDETIYGGSNLRPVTPVVYNILRPPRTYGIRAAFHF
jgi:iron complex outermembrane recepter protein